MNTLAKDLIALRLSKKWSQRELGQQAGVNYGAIQRFESRIQASLSLEDFNACLEACGSSLVTYLGQYAMTTNELDLLNDDADLIEKFKLALKLPTKRVMLKAFLDGLVADVSPDPQSPKGRRGRQPFPSKDRKSG